MRHKRREPQWEALGNFIRTKGVPLGIWSVCFSGNYNLGYYFSKATSSIAFSGHYVLYTETMLKEEWVYSPECKGEEKICMHEVTLSAGLASEQEAGEEHTESGDVTFYSRRHYNTSAVHNKTYSEV